MGKEIKLIACNTKSCIFNKDDQCTQDSIIIRHGKCITMKSKKLFNEDGKYTGYVKGVI